MKQYIKELEDAYNKLDNIRNLLCYYCTQEISCLKCPMDGARNKLRKEIEYWMKEV